MARNLPSGEASLRDPGLVYDMDTIPERSNSGDPGEASPVLERAVPDRGGRGRGRHGEGSGRGWSRRGGRWRQRSRRAGDEQDPTRFFVPRDAGRTEAGQR